MKSNSERMVPVFVPGLAAILIREEDAKGAPLTQAEVLAIRDRSACIMMEADDARSFMESRGYADIDPDNYWQSWQEHRRATGREPALDPGPRFYSNRPDDPGYQQTIQDARASLGQFRALLPADGTWRRDALIKVRLNEGDRSALLWLNNAAIEGEGFTADLFEVPEDFVLHKVGDRFAVNEEELLDWMVNHLGRLIGGYSLRYHRAQLPDSEKQAFDDLIGARHYD